MKWKVWLGMWGWYSLLMMSMAVGQTNNPQGQFRMKAGDNTENGWMKDMMTEFLMADTIITTCSGLFTDPGGKKFNYPGNQDLMMTFYPETGHQIKISFRRFDVEYQANCSFDHLKVLNGTDVEAPLLGIFCGQSLPGDLIGNNPEGALTFVFHSDLTVEAQGWEALITCIPVTFPPVAGFSANHTVGVPGEIILFQDQSVPVPSSWYWNVSPDLVTFTDGTNQSSMNPCISFPHQGMYEISLVAENAFGSDTVIKQEYIHIRDYLLYEDFEAEDSLPAGWTEETISGNPSWLCLHGSPANHPPLAYEGTYNAFLAGASGQAMLVSPWIDTDSSAATLVFRHYQEAFAGWQDHLSIWYRIDPAGPWISIPGAEWFGNTPSWTLRTVILPCIQIPFQLGFLGMVSGGYGVCMDELSIVPEATMLVIQLILQGFYDPVTGQMLPAQDENGTIWNDSTADLIHLSIHDPDPPFHPLMPQVDVLLQTSGHAWVMLPGYLDSLVLLAIHHRSSLETWSALPMNLNHDTVTYAFISGAAKAFGSNQRMVYPGIFALYSGDINQDGVIDSNDLGLLETDILHFQAGYLSTDLNGDGIIDSVDDAILEMNVSGFLEVHKP